MAENDLRKSFRSRGAPFIVFLVISLVLNGLGAVSGWWWKFPESPPLKDVSIQLTELDTNDVEKLGDPDAPEEQPMPPEPEPTPPPPEPEPTPPPLDKPPEFEVPEPTPTPAPVTTPTPAPVSTPIPHPTPKPQPSAPRPVEHTKPATAPAPASGLVKGGKTGAPNGTGTGGSRSGTLLRSPSPSYPPQALQMHIMGEVRVAFTVQNGNIVDARAISGPPMLTSYVIRFCKENWKFSPNSNGTYTLPVSFQLH